MTSSRPRRTATAASAPSRTFDRPRAGPASSGSSRERVARGRSSSRPRRRRRSAAARRDRRRAPAAGRRPAPVRAGARDSRIARVRASRSAGRRCRASSGMASSPTLASAWSSRGPPSAPRIDDARRAARRRPRAPPARCPTRPCSDEARSIGTPLAASAASASRVEGVAVADPVVDASGRAPRRGERRRRRRRRPRLPSAQPGQAASSAARDGHVAVGDDERLHGRRCYAPSRAATARRRPDARLPPCPTRLDHPADPPRPRRRRPQGRRRSRSSTSTSRPTPRRRPPRPSTPSSARSSSRWSSSRPPTTARSSRSSASSPARTASTSRAWRPSTGEPEDPARDRERGQRADRLHDRRHPADRPRAAGPRRHGPGPRAASRSSGPRPACRPRSSRSRRPRCGCCPTRRRADLRGASATADARGEAAVDGGVTRGRPAPADAGCAGRAAQRGHHLPRRPARAAGAGRAAARPRRSSR